MLSNNFDIEYELEKRIKIFLQKSFENDVKFSYNISNRASHLLISTEYPDVYIDPMDIPAIYIKSLDTSINNNATFYNNYLRDTPDANGVLRYEERLFIVPYSAILICAGNNSSITKDLCGKTQKYIAMSHIGYLNHSVGLNLSGEVRKSSVVLRQQFPNRIYEGMVMFSGNLHLISTTDQQLFNTSAPEILQDINFNAEIGLKLVSPVLETRTVEINNETQNIEEPKVLKVVQKELYILPNKSSE